MFCDPCFVFVCVVVCALVPCFEVCMFVDLCFVFVIYVLCYAWLFVFVFCVSCIVIVFALCVVFCC